MTDSSPRNSARPPADPAPELVEAIPFEQVASTAAGKSGAKAQGQALRLLSGLMPLLASPASAPALSQMTVTLRLRRVHSYLVKKIVWTAPRADTQTSSTFDGPAALDFLQNVLATADKLGWPADRLDITVDNGAIDWRRSPDVPGAATWGAQAAQPTDMTLFDPSQWPGFDVGSGDFSNRLFSVEARPVLVDRSNSEHPVILSAGTRMVLPGFSTDPVALADLVTDGRGDVLSAWAKEPEQLASAARSLNVSADLPYLRPSVEIAFILVPPPLSGEAVALPDAAAADRSGAPARPRVKAWQEHRMAELHTAATRLGQSACLAFLSALTDNHGQPGPWALAGANPLLSSGSNDDLEHCRQRLAASPVSEIGFGPIPNSAPEFLDQLRTSDMPEALRNDILSGLMHSMLDGVLGAPNSEEGRMAWAHKNWYMLPDVREWLVEGLPADADGLITAERSAFVTCLEYQEKQPGGLSGYIRTLDTDERLAFRDLLFWNGASLSPAVRAALRGAPEPSSDPSEDVAPIEVARPIVPFASVAAPVLPPPAPLTDSEQEHWLALCAAFGVDLADVSSAESANPFLRWLERLSPPEDVASFTRKWLVQNEKFNDINRDLLSTRGADEAEMTTELAKRLTRVQEASRAVMDKSRAAGGWWERLRGTAVNKDVTPEEWADAFMDFQTHLVKVFKSIEEQITRDRSWLTVTDDLGASATDVDNRWVSWLSQTARGLDAERSQPGAEQLSAEKKIAWNSRALTLESASTAHEHIRSSSAITRILLEKVRQSVDVKERLQQRATMFYWSTLNLFAGLQSVQRTTNSVMEQSELNSLMARSFEAMVTRTSIEEEEQRERLRASFRTMAKSETSMAAFYTSLSSFQKDTLSLMGDLVSARDSATTEAAEVQQEHFAVAPASIALAIAEPDEPQELLVGSSPKHPAAADKRRGASRPLTRP